MVVSMTLSYPALFRHGQQINGRLEDIVSTLLYKMVTETFLSYKHGEVEIH